MRGMLLLQPSTWWHEQVTQMAMVQHEVQPTLLEVVLCSLDRNVAGMYFHVLRHLLQKTGV